MFETCFVVEIVKSIEVMQLAENINYIIGSIIHIERNMKFNFAVKGLNV